VVEQVRSAGQDPARALDPEQLKDSAVETARHCLDEAWDSLSSHEQAHGRRRLSAGDRPRPPAPPAGRVPRVARLMAS
jgi:hypothetical protein